MYKSKFNQLYNQIITQMTKLTTNANKKLLAYKAVEQQYNNLMTKYNNLLNNSKEAQTKILQLHPELVKRIERIKANPKDAWQAGSKLHLVDAKYNDIYTGSMYSSNLVSTFGNSLYQAYNLNKEITRAKNKLDTLKYQLGDLTNAISTIDSFEENLPQEFIDVLDKLKQYIISLQQDKKAEKVYKAKKFAEAPLHNTVLKIYQTYKNSKGNIFSLSTFPNSDLYVTYFKANNFQNSISLPETQEQLLKAIINANIQKYNDNISYKEYRKNQIIKQYSMLISNTNSNVSSAEKIDAVGIATSIFNEIKAQFLDKLSQYCTKIISAENVYLGADGSINGIVHAQNGIFNVRTITAGGYNIQRLHFRVIITPLNDKNYQKLKNNEFY